MITFRIITNDKSECNEPRKLQKQLGKYIANTGWFRVRKLISGFKANFAIWANEK